MDCCDPKVYDDQFDARDARRRLRELRTRGPNAWTQRLIDGLAADGAAGRSVLDIGAGIGAVHLALLANGATSAVDVDASGPYLAAAREEAERRGVADRVAYHRGDAVRLAPEIAPADLVALDRVVCCYPDMDGLVRMAAERTQRRLGMVLPRDAGWIRAGIALSNGIGALTRNPFRVHVHPTDAVVRVARAAGLTLVDSHKGLVWQTLILERRAW